MHRRILTALFYGLLYLPLGSFAEHLQGNNKLKQYFLTFPPYWEQINETTFSGVHYRLAQKVYQHAGLAVDFVNVPYNRMQQQVAAGKIPFINYGEVDSQKTEDILHICVPPTEITLRVYYLDESLEEFYTEQGFENQQVIILHDLPLGNFEGIKANKAINFMRPSTIKAAIQGLVAGRGNYFIVFDNMMVNAQQRFFPLNSYQLRSYPLYTMLGYPITTPKTFPNGEQLCAKVLASYQQLVEKGVINKEYKILAADVQGFALK